jgi:glutamine cyclotransferase
MKKLTSKQVREGVGWQLLTEFEALIKTGDVKACQKRAPKVFYELECKLLINNSAHYKKLEELQKRFPVKLLRKRS